MGHTDHRDVVYRMGLERAKRYLLTGDEISAPEAARIGLILEAVPDDQLDAHATALAERMAQVPRINSRCSSCSAITPPRIWGWRRPPGRLALRRNRTHTQEGLDFVARAQAAGFRKPSASAMIRSATTAQARARKIARSRKAQEKKLI